MTLDEIKQLAIFTQQKVLREEEKELFASSSLVLSSGNIKSKLMVIARDLGQEELNKGIPLIGQAGQLYRIIEKSLLEQKLLTEEPYITNTVPFKPKDNKAFPKITRMKFRQVLLEQIQLVQPIVIITLGNEAMEDLTGNIGIMKNIYENKIFRPVGDINVKCYIVPAIHPSYLIRKGINSKTIFENKEYKEQYTDLLLNPIYKAVKMLNGVKDVTKSLL